MNEGIEMMNVEKVFTQKSNSNSAMTIDRYEL